jgi:Cu/Ag efflux protein CusF
MEHNYMRSLIISMTAAVMLFAACSSGSDAKKRADAPEQEIVYAVRGVVKKVDPAAGKLTIDHEAIEGYMQAMEMELDAEDTALSADPKPGERVEFELRRVGSRLTVISLKKTGESIAVNAAEIYKANCAECHGDKGEGTSKGISLVKGHALHHTVEEHLKQVTDGEDDKMPAFRDKLKPDEIKAVVAYVRDEIQKGAVRDDSSKHKH